MSVIVPCHNEADCIRETMTNLDKLDYPDYEIIAVNDGSTDGTGEVLLNLQNEIERLRVVTMARNGGKAAALKAGTLISNSEYLVAVDADAFLSPDALRWLVWHFIKFPRVGAVTGNPRIRNRTSLLGKIQVGEYSTIIGMIKRTQRIIGKVFTVSGVAVAFRKRALMDVGFWSDDMATEDIDITWKLEERFWDVRFEENALCWILTPESLSGLWQQRVRWAQGGAEVIIKYGKSLFDIRQRRFWPIFVEYAISVVWTYAFWFAVFVALINLIFPELHPPFKLVRIFPPEWTGTFLALVCMAQAGSALLFESSVEKGLFRYLFWFIWYPLAYWVISAFAMVVGLPKAILHTRGKRAVWESPDRGLR
jgi:biofilm PGA synthesis N-glycosyltransferase PgaC